MTTPGRREVLAAIAILAGFALVFRRVGVGRFNRSHAKATTVSAQPGNTLGEVGAVLPELDLTDVNDNPLSSADFQGKVLLVDYWAPWCQPCEKEMPGYQQLYDKYRERGLVVLGVLFDPGMSMGDESPDHFAKRLCITYPFVKDSPELQAQFGGIKGIPTTFIIDRKRVIRYKVVGFEYTANIEAALQPLL